MRPVPLMRAAGLRPFADFLRRLGSPVERWLAEVKLSPRVLADGETLVTVGQAHRFMEDAARAEGIPDLGLLVGQETSLGALGVFGRQLLRARTVGEAFETAVATAPLVTSGLRCWMEVASDRAMVAQRFVDGLDEHGQADQYGLMLGLNILRLGAGAGWQPTEMHLELPRPAAPGDLEPLMGCALRFGQPATGVVFPRAVLDLPLPSVDGPAASDLDMLAAWRESAPSDDFPRALVQVADALSSVGYPHIGSAADAMGMSVRSLQRRLAEAGVTYKSLVARARFAAAAALLEKHDTKILDVALDLGYSDHAHFTRAFRRWTGTAPREFRRRAQRAVAAPAPHPA